MLGWHKAKADWTAFKANAKLAKDSGTATSLELSCLRIKDELNEYVDMLSKAAPAKAAAFK